MNNVIPFRYRGEPVSFNSAGWINATEIAKREKWRLDKWLATQETQECIAALGRHLNTPEKGDLIMTRRGRNGGTWLHPKLAVFFARWISADFAVWCDLQIDALLRGEESALAQFNRTCLAYDQGVALSSAHGADLSLWKQEKPRLLGAVERVRSLLQMTLALETQQ
ncbi:TPA: KilA-N domain-containing protein [Pseudomonas aeruginosa]|uniref:KilA-N domain-containing protein n=1 Tax=Pseudomonas aeruginosa TaxID=287 RepID=UPI00053D25B8|nr:KilA-N domain-containing protein [Pseudomonas aeruginosa]EJB8384334.1 KilA-N domain-containing protein [Pseudomonas aeruginosa]MDG4130567.1 KilA-N domain-containing protein [Pseudomonas aeruginosa]RPN94015.1 DNA-binding protein [Pseudomonas aeruginosa]HCL3570207.1 KilA-N domain-containing protein [Pseudomonas aeruginosa]HEN8459961.1 KilA-N domain-containing protein [Pseudomonas aeruginosa]